MAWVTKEQIEQEHQCIRCGIIFKGVAYRGQCFNCASYVDINGYRPSVEMKRNRGWVEGVGVAVDKQGHEVHMKVTKNRYIGPTTKPMDDFLGLK